MDINCVMTFATIAESDVVEKDLESIDISEMHIDVNSLQVCENLLQLERLKLKNNISYVANSG